jgi:hypothetical protein
MVNVLPHRIDVRRLSYDRNMRDGQLEAETEIRRQIGELTEEIRVALPGTQVLFAFLLGIPFTNRFNDIVSGANTRIYFIAFLAAAVSSVLLIAPSAIHRIIHGDGGHRGWYVTAATYLAVGGIVFLLVAIASTVYLVSDVLYDKWTAGITAAALSVLAGTLWFVVPIARRQTD